MLVRWVKPLMPLKRFTAQVMTMAIVLVAGAGVDAAAGTLAVGAPAAVRQGPSLELSCAPAAANGRANPSGLAASKVADAPRCFDDAAAAAESGLQPGSPELALPGLWSGPAASERGDSGKAVSTSASTADHQAARAAGSGNDQGPPPNLQGVVIAALLLLAALLLRRLQR